MSRRASQQAGRTLRVPLHPLGATASRRIARRRKARTSLMKKRLVPFFFGVGLNQRHRRERQVQARREGSINSPPRLQPGSRASKGGGYDAP